MIEVHFEDINEVPGVNPEFLFSWFSEVCESEYKVLGAVNLIFCSDEYLLEMNREHLDHDYYTDIITFDYCMADVISGDLFISVDRVRENADQFCVLFNDELHRVCVHGLLHLCGYNDKNDVDEAMMRSKENEKLELRKFHVEHLKD
jgi:probable rRNA maturation factor